MEHDQQYSTLMAATIPNEFALNLHTTTRIQEKLQRQLTNCRSSIARHVGKVLRRRGIELGTFRNTTIDQNQPIPVYRLNTAMQRALSSLISSHGYTLAEVIKLVRGETSTDPRPNKALCPATIKALLMEYPHRDLLVDIATRGFDVPTLKNAPSQSQPGRNYPSAREHVNVLCKAIREGQDSGHYLVLDSALLSKLDRVQCSPFAVIPKKDVDIALEGRIIHDLSSPFGQSTNDYTEKSALPSAIWRSVSTLADRIVSLQLRNRTSPNPPKLMGQCGDVKKAFRNLRVRNEAAHWFGNLLPSHNALIIDMSAPMGWTGSPQIYSMFGNAISYLMQSLSPASLDPNDPDVEKFFGFEWVDDHILLELDVGNRLEYAESALRLCMIALLGPESLNEKKFTGWKSLLHALGLDWDFDLGLVSMPDSKIKKALGRVDNLLNRSRTSKKQLQELLGSLRHVCTCIPAARPFYQRLHIAMVRAHKNGVVKMTDDMQLDLKWFNHILHYGRLRSIPVSLMTSTQEPSVHLYMDASDVGLAILDPAQKRYIQIQFSPHEIQMVETSKRMCLCASTLTDPSSPSNPMGQNSNSHRTPHPSASRRKKCSACVKPMEFNFNINTREHLCVAFAVLLWGPSWLNENQVTHIKCWSDNTSCVAWTNSMASPNIFSQTMNRALGLSQARFNLHVTAQHLPGAINTMADAGSRCPTQPHLDIWKSMSVGWTQTQVPVSLRQPYYQRFETSSMLLWPAQVSPHTMQPGTNGQNGATQTNTAPSCPTVPTANQINSSTSSSIYGKGPFQGQNPTVAVPFGPSSAKSAGIISDSVDTRQASMRGTNLHSKASPNSMDQSNGKSHLHSKWSKKVDAALTTNSPMTAVSGGLRSWGFSFFMRRSEYLLCRGKESRHGIRRRHVTFLDTERNPTTLAHQVDAVKIYFPSSKNDQAAQGTYRTHKRSGHPTFCPVAAAWSLWSAHDFDNEYLCSYPSSEGQRTVLRQLSETSISQFIKQCATVTGLSPSNYSSHSVRIGGTTSLFEANTRQLAIKKMGRWRSGRFPNLRTNG